ncbi:MAG: hypothetical protein Q9162_005087 [Coniocarpon cinnabarinum]
MVPNSKRPVLKRRRLRRRIKETCEDATQTIVDDRASDARQSSLAYALDATSHNEHAEDAVKNGLRSLPPELFSRILAHYFNDDENLPKPGRKCALFHVSRLVRQHAKDALSRAIRSQGMMEYPRSEDILRNPSQLLTALLRILGPRLLEPRTGRCPEHLLLQYGHCRYSAVNLHKGALRFAFSDSVQLLTISFILANGPPPVWECMRLGEVMPRLRELRLIHRARDVVWDPEGGWILTDTQGHMQRRIPQRIGWKVIDTQAEEIHDATFRLFAQARHFRLTRLGRDTVESE